MDGYDWKLPNPILKLGRLNSTSRLDIDWTSKWGSGQCMFKKTQWNTVKYRNSTKYQTHVQYESSLGKGNIYNNCTCQFPWFLPCFNIWKDMASGLIKSQIKAWSVCEHQAEQPNWMWGTLYPSLQSRPKSSSLATSHRSSMHRARLPCHGPRDQPGFSAVGKNMKKCYIQ